MPRQPWGTSLGFCHELPNLQDTVLQDIVLKDSMDKHPYAVIRQTLARESTNQLKSLTLFSAVVSHKSMQ
jgi:hypothetical protein